MRLFKDVRAIKRSIAELRSTDAVEEEKAAFELAASAYRFSRDTKASVDDKLSFSATLMRAGEIQAATRLIVELEDDVREEEVALVEVINEVHAARSLRREKITRLRLARVLVTSMLGACIMGFSAMGIGAAGMFADRAAAPKPARVAVSSNVDRSGRGNGAPARARKLRHVRIGGTLVALNKVQLGVLRDLQKGKIDPESLEEFLASLPSEVVDSVRMMFLSVTTPVEEAVTETVGSTSDASTKGPDAATKPVKETKEDPPDGPENPPPPTQNTNNTDTPGTLKDTKGLPL